MTLAKLKNLFRKSEADPFDVKVLTKDVDAAERWLIGAKTVYDGAFERQVAAQAALDEVLAEVSDKYQTLSDAKSAYSENPSGSRQKVVREEKTALEMAELRAEKPRRTVVDATAATEAAGLGVVEAEQKLAKARNALRIAELRKTASLDSYREKSAPLLGELAEQIEAARSTAEKIAQIWGETTAAVELLRVEGVDCAEAEPLYIGHILSSLLIERAEQNPACSGPMLRSVGIIQFNADPVGDIQVKCSGLDAIEELSAMTFEGDYREDLRALLDKRRPTLGTTGALEFSNAWEKRQRAKGEP
jgi:hypothetical protein